MEECLEALGEDKIMTQSRASMLDSIKLQSLYLGFTFDKRMGHKVIERGVSAVVNGGTSFVTIVVLHQNNNVPEF